MESNVYAIEVICDGMWKSLIFILVFNELTPIRCFRFFGKSITEQLASTLRKRTG